MLFIWNPVLFYLFVLFFIYLISWLERHSLESICIFSILYIEYIPIDILTSEEAKKKLNRVK